MKKKPIRKIDIMALLTIFLIVGSLGGIYWARWQWVDDLAPRLIQKDVLIFDKMENSLQRVILHDDENASPLSILALDNKVLIVDNNNIRIKMVTYEGV